MRKAETARIAAALGATRTVELKGKRIGGPLDLLALRTEFNQRLRSSGGRPTDPAWTVSRQVPFKEDSWTRLQDLAREVGESGRRVGPAQVAALLIETGLEDLEEAQWQQALECSRSTPLLSQPAAADAAGVTYNQLDEWVELDWIIPASRRGRQRSYGADEIIRAIWLRSISQAHSDIEDIAIKIRSSDLAARYLVVTNGEAMSTLATRSDLCRQLGTPGSHLVIDQLPERRKLLGLPPFSDGSHDQQSTRRAV